MNRELGVQQNLLWRMTLNLDLMLLLISITYGLQGLTKQENKAVKSGENWVCQAANRKAENAAVTSPPKVCFMGQQHWRDITQELVTDMESWAYLSRLSHTY